MSEEHEWGFFEAYCTGVIESVMKSQVAQPNWPLLERAEMAARIITRNAKDRFLVMPEAEG